MRIRQVLILSLLWLVTASSLGQSKDVQFLLDTTLSLMQRHSVNAASVNWAALRKEIYAQSAGKENAYQLGPVYRKLFEAVGDFHGAFFCWDSSYKWQRPESPYPDSIVNEWKKGVTIQTKLLDGNIGYLRVPFMSFAQRPALDAKAQALNDSLCALIQGNVKGIVLDLRLNGGGAMFPMMLGLQQVLGEGKIGSFVTNPPEDWIIKNNGFYLDTTLLTAIVPKCKILPASFPVAVLIGRGTGSSGEFLAMAFKERKNTIFIGDETAGYITVNQGFPINDAVSLLLAVGYGTDRTGRVYKAALVADIINREPDNFNNIKSDKKVLAAMKWITDKKK